jgi:protein-disulfide isomerase
MKKNILTILSIAQFCILIAMAIFLANLHFRYKKIEKTTSELESSLMIKKRQSIPMDDKDIIQGNKNATTQFIVYANPNCKHCKAFFDEVYPQLLRDYINTGKIKFVIKYMPPVNRPVAFYAAKAAICMNEQGWTNEIIEITENERIMVDSSRIRKAIFSLKIDTLVFNSCMQQGAIGNHVILDRMVAMKLGVEGTPSFLINGNLFIGSKSYSEFKNIIDSISIANPIANHQNNNNICD